MTTKNYFFNPLKSAILMGAVFLLASIIMSYSTQPPLGKTGAPAESTCMDCHNSPNPNYGGHLEVLGLPSVIVPGQTYYMTVNSVSTGTAPSIGGFELVMLDADQANAGTITILDENTTNKASQTNRDYIRHNGTQIFNMDTVSWAFQWTAPANAVGNISVYAASVLADSDGGTGGDRVLLYADTFALYSATPLEVTIADVTNPTCYGLANGVAHAVVENGVAPYEFEWSTGATSTWVYDLAAGTYTVTVTDAVDSTGTAEITIGQPDTLIASITASAIMIPCGDSVLLKANVTGGTGNYSYTWNTGNSTADSVFVHQGGYYCVSVFDENQCGATACTGVNNDSNGIFCNGIDVDTITCDHPTRFLFPGVTANDTIFYSWTGPDGFASSDTMPEISAGGQYTLVATMPSGCTCTSTVEVVQETEFALSVTSTSPTTCSYLSDGAVEADITAGDVAPFTIVPNIDPDSLAVGDYNLTITNGAGCTTAVSFNITGPDAIETSTTSITASNDNDSFGAIDIETTGGSPAYSWTWTFSGTPAATYTNEDPTNLHSGDYMLAITDAHDCVFNFGPFNVPFISANIDVAFANSLAISPNPAQDFITITQSDKVQNIDVDLIGINNQLIGKYHFAQKTGQIDVSQLPAGVYGIIIRSDNQTAFKQLVKK